MDLKVESRDGVLVATAAGRVSLSEAIRLFPKACDVAAERDFDRILVDSLPVEGELSTSMNSGALWQNTATAGP